MKKLLFATLTKINEELREVTGVAVCEERDLVKEIMDYATTKPHIEAWSKNASDRTNGQSLGNVRAMHTAVAAGKLVKIDFHDDAKSVEVTAKIVDEAEWEKCKEGVYTGFSIGGKYLKKWADPALPGTTRYTGAPTEISLVDLPCVPGASFTMVKGAGIEETIQFKPAEKTDPLSKYGQLKKGMWNIKTLAQILEDLKWCRESSVSEEMFEGDNSAIPGRLGAVMAVLGQILVDMAVEEVEEYSPEKEGEQMDNAEKLAKALELLTEASADLKKAGATHSKDTMEKIQAIHDHTGDMGAEHAGKHDERRLHHPGKDREGGRGRRHEKAPGADRRSEQDHHQPG